MSGLKLGLVALAIMACAATSGRAQDFVPGGWDAEFGYLPFGGQGIVGGGTFGAGSSGYGVIGSPYGQGFSPYGRGMGSLPYPNPGSPYGNSCGMSMTVDGTDPLIQAIRRTTRTSRRR